MSINAAIRKSGLLCSAFLYFQVLFGQSPQFAWAQAFGNTGVSDASVLTVDNSENSYMAGTYGTGGITFGSISLSSSGSSSNGFIVKFDPQGNALWAKRVRRVGGFQDSTNPDRIAIDNSGNVYLCGFYLNGAMIDTAVLPGDFGYFIAKFDASGNLQWTKTTQTLDSVQSYNSIHVNSEQEVIMTGLYNTMIQFSADHTITNPTPTGIAGFLVKYDGAGNVLSSVDLGLSNLLLEPWAPYPTEYFRYDSSDHIYRFVVETNSLMKYDGEGALLSSQTFGIGEHVFITDMTIGPNEAVYFSGNFSNIFQFESESIESPWGPDITPVGFVSKINAEGLVDWTYTTTSQFPKYINKVKVDQIGSVYLQASAAYGGSMYYQSMIKLDSSRNLIWEEKFYNTNAEGNIVGGIIPRNIAQAQNGGNIFMAGTFRNFIRFNESVNLSTTGSVWRIYLAQYGLCDMPTPEITAEAEAFCPGDSVEIAPTNSGSFLWSTGDTTSTLEATLPGDYFAFAVDSLGCFAASNTVSIATHPVPSPPLLTASSLAFCPGSGVILSTPENPNATWSTGEVGDSIFVNSGGFYFVQNTNEFGCWVNSDTLSIVEYPVPESPSIEASSLSFCVGSGVTISSNESDNYVWSTGEIGDSIFVNSEGFYFVQNTNEFGCWVNSDTLEITELPLPINGIELVGTTLYALEENGIYQWIDCDENNLEIEGETLQSYSPMVNGSYAVQVTNTFGCTISTECLPVLVTNMNELHSESEWNIYPNPAQNFFFVNTGSTEVQTTVFTLEGKVLFYTNGRQINIEHLPAGNYLIKLRSDKREETILLNRR
jgi:hypothetical protein